MWLRQYRDRFLTYFNREKFNDVQETIDPWEYHNFFVACAASFSVMDYEKLPIYSYFVPTFSIFCASTAAILFFFAFVHGMQAYDIHFMTESGIYLLLMCYQIQITTSVLKGRKEYHNLMRDLKEDFHYISTRGQKYRDKFFENQKVTFKGCFLVAVVMFLASTGVAGLAFIGVVVAIQRMEEGDEKQLPFPVFVPHYDNHKSPLYEFLFGSTLVYTFCYTYVYIFLSMSHIFWVRGITSKADIVSWNLEDLLVDIFPAKNNKERDYYAALIKHRMREIIEIHQAMFRMLLDYASVYKKCLLFEQTIASPALCMIAYCFVEKYESGETHLLLLPLFFGIIIMVYLPNYLGTHLLDKIQSIGDACWDVPFWNSGVVLKPYLVLLMQISMRPLPIVAPGFAEVSLETYATILTRAYSGFNMLRTADFDISK